MWERRNGGREWRVTAAGIVSRGDEGETFHRTRGEPKTMRVYWAAWGDDLMAIARTEAVPVALLLMTIATENGPARDLDGLILIPVRKEPGYISDRQTPHRISVGPCHPLISTAREVWGDDTIDRSWLQVPANNIRLCARYIAQRASAHRFDPILTAAVYNAGSLKPAPEASPDRKIGNRWRLRSYGSHLDRAANWYGDACAMLDEANELSRLDRTGLGRSPFTP